VVLEQRKEDSQTHSEIALHHDLRDRGHDSGATAWRSAAVREKHVDVAGRMASSDERELGNGYVAQRDRIASRPFAWSRRRTPPRLAWQSRHTLTHIWPRSAATDCEQIGGFADAAPRLIFVEPFEPV